MSENWDRISKIFFKQVKVEPSRNFTVNVMNRLESEAPNSAFARWYLPTFEFLLSIIILFFVITAAPNSLPLSIEKLVLAKNNPSIEVMLGTNTQNDWFATTSEEL